MADLNRMAHRIVKAATELETGQGAAEASGRKGGLKRGGARARKLTAKQRSEIARSAAKARGAKAS